MAVFMVEELSGALLDAAVAKAAGLQFELRGGQCYVKQREMRYRDAGRGDGFNIVRLPAGADEVMREFKPSSDWSVAGPLIEREGIALWRSDSGWVANMPGAGGYPGDLHYIDVSCIDVGVSSACVAAMRAWVESKLGPYVDQSDFAK